MVYNQIVQFLVEVTSKFRHFNDLARLMFGTNSICYQRPKAGYET